MVEETKDQLCELLEQGLHEYGETVSASFETIEKLPMFALRAYTEYKLGRVESVTKEELKDMLNSWYHTPWKSEEEINQLKEQWLLKKQNEWSQLCERPATAVQTDPEHEKCKRQKRD